MWDLFLTGLISGQEEQVWDQFYSIGVFCSVFGCQFVGLVLLGVVSLLVWAGQFNWLRKKKNKKKEGGWLLDRYSGIIDRYDSLVWVTGLQ